jgi:hypothetical protein
MRRCPLFGAQVELPKRLVLDGFTRGGAPS